MNAKRDQVYTYYDSQNTDNKQQAAQNSTSRKRSTIKLAMAAYDLMTQALDNAVVIVSVNVSRQCKRLTSAHVKRHNVTYTG
jgi:hypothetical protein